MYTIKTWQQALAIIVLMFCLFVVFLVANWLTIDLQTQWFRNHPDLITDVFQHRGNWQLEFSPVEDVLASRSLNQNNSVQMWHFGERNAQHQPSLVPSSIARDIAFSPDGQALAVLQSGAIEFFSVNDGALIQNLPAPEAMGLQLAYSPVDTMIVEGYNNPLRLRYASDGRVIRRLAWPRNFSGIGDIAFSPDGTLVAANLTDQTVRLWQISNGNLLHTFRVDKITWVVAFSPDSTQLAIGARDQVEIWDVNTLSLTHTLGNASGSEVRTLLDASIVGNIVFSSDGALVIVGSSEGTVRIWRLADESLLVSIPTAPLYDLRPVHVALSHDDSILAVGQTRGQIWLLDFQELLAICNTE